MYSVRTLDRWTRTAIIVAVALVVYLLLEIVDRVTASPAMRARVNEGSDKFVAERGSIWHAALRSTLDFVDRAASRWI